MVEMINIAKIAGWSSGRPCPRFRKRGAAGSADCEIAVGHGKRTATLHWNEANPDDMALTIGRFGVEPVTYEDLADLAWNLFALLQSDFIHEQRLCSIWKKCYGKLRIFPYRGATQHGLRFAFDKQRGNVVVMR